MSLYYRLVHDGLGETTNTDIWIEHFFHTNYGRQLVSDHIAALLNTPISIGMNR